MVGIHKNYVKASETSPEFDFTEPVITFTGMIPVVMKFGKLTGFVIKYWQWLPDRESGRDLTTGNKYKYDPLKQSSTGRQRIRRLINPPLLENDLFRGSLSEFRRFKRTVPKKFQSESNIPRGSVFKGENYTFHRIAERVVLIIFNETDTNLVNASQTEITQICKSSVNCQPDVVFQKQSRKEKKEKRNKFWNMKFSCNNMC